MDKKVKTVVKNQVINAIYTIALNEDLRFPTGSFIVDTPNMGKIEIEEAFFNFGGSMDFICYCHYVGNTKTDKCFSLELENLDLNTLITILQHITKNI